MIFEKSENADCAFWGAKSFKWQQTVCHNPSIGPILGKVDIEIRFDDKNRFDDIEVWIEFWSRGV